MANYTVAGVDTSTATTTILYVVNDASVVHRLKLFEVFIAASISSDSAYEGFIRRITAENGTPGGTPVTPVENDPADPSADSKAVSGPTGEPVYTANSEMLITGGHQRSSFLWSPGQSREIIAPATGDNGFGHEIQISATPFNLVMHMRYGE